VAETEAAAPDIGQRLAATVRAARKAAGLSQEDLAVRVGLTRTAITNLEAGRQGLTVPRLLMTAKVLGIDLGTLLLPEDLPVMPPLPHNVIIRRVYEVTCETCGGRVLDGPVGRKDAETTRRDHIRDWQEANGA
jgi:transcriptional regulator with XRE-family HTH domain